MFRILHHLGANAFYWAFEDVWMIHVWEDFSTWPNTFDC